MRSSNKRTSQAVKELRRNIECDENLGNIPLYKVQKWLKQIDQAYGHFSWWCLGVNKNEISLCEDWWQVF